MNVSEHPHVKRCRDFREAVEDDSEFIECRGSAGGLLFFIRGKPDVVDEGDGHYCDMTRDTVITHCPFCGEKL